MQRPSSRFVILAGAGVGAGAGGAGIGGVGGARLRAGKVAGGSGSTRSRGRQRRRSSGSGRGLIAATSSPICSSVCLAARSSVVTVRVAPLARTSAGRSSGPELGPASDRQADIAARGAAGMTALRFRFVFSAGRGLGSEGGPTRRWGHVRERDRAAAWPRRSCTCPQCAREAGRGGGPTSCKKTDARIIDGGVQAHHRERGASVAQEPFPRVPESASRRCSSS